MQKTRQRQCTKCGDSHMRKADVCYSCDPAFEKPAPIPCAVCDEPFVVGKHRSHSKYCSNACASAVSRARARVISAVNAKVARGDLARPASAQCVDCGGPAREYDHRHYLRPFDVVPVCHSCNLKRGPAEDVKDFVASHLGINVHALAGFMAQRRRRKEAA